MGGGGYLSCHRIKEKKTGKSPQCWKKDDLLFLLAKSVVLGWLAKSAAPSLGSIPSDASQNGLWSPSLFSTDTPVFALKQELEACELGGPFMCFNFNEN